jgi:pantothenate kinase
MDGYHLSRRQLDSLPDPTSAHARRGAEFTFDGESFLKLVKKLREPLCPETQTLFAPSFDHAVKDPGEYAYNAYRSSTNNLLLSSLVADDIAIAPSIRIIIFEGNYLSLDKSPWKDAAAMMNELWFVEVDVDVARKRLIYRHVKAGIAEDEDSAARRADENDLVNGKEITENRLKAHEVVISKDDDEWKPE